VVAFPATVFSEVRSFSDSDLFPSLGVLEEASGLALILAGLASPIGRPEAVWGSFFEDQLIRCKGRSKEN
jgi:hypothetical protein